jgi:hypothetical protein
MERISNRPSFPRLELFKAQFRSKYGRDMTSEEAKFFQLTEDVLLNPPEEEAERQDDDAA